MLADKQITIAGFGLMGGSLALALRPHVAKITAVDPNPQTRAQAVEQGVADAAEADLAAALPDADLLILAAPARAIAATLARLPDLWPQGGLVMDVGSVKGPIVQAMDSLPERFQAIGGHPMCGREVSGLAAALPDLYQGKTFILSRTARTTPLIEQTALAVVTAVQARPLFSPPTYTTGWSPRSAICPTSRPLPSCKSPRRWRPWSRTCGRSAPPASATAPAWPVLARR